MQLIHSRADGPLYCVYRKNSRFEHFDCMRFYGFHSSTKSSRHLEECWKSRLENQTISSTPEEACLISNFESWRLPRLQRAIIWPWFSLVMNTMHVIVWDFPIFFHVARKLNPLQSRCKVRHDFERQHCENDASTRFTRTQNVSHNYEILVSWLSPKKGKIMQQMTRLN